MLAWFSDNIFTAGLIVCFFVASAYAIWLRLKMSVSKARFALSVVAAMVTCSTALLAFLSTPVPIQVLNALIATIKGGFGYPSSSFQFSDGGWFSTILAFAITVLVIYLIYKFAITAIINWDGPVTVNVNELAKREQDNSLTLLAFVELKRILSSQPDPLASDVAVNWQQKQSAAPAAPAWPTLARNLFEAAFSEALFGETAWRDRYQAWVGEIYISRPRASDTVPLVLFVFEARPSEKDLEFHLSSFLADGALLSEAKVFVVFNDGPVSSGVSVNVTGVSIELWSRHSLLRKGLRLEVYARDLIKRFNKDVLGGTTATLKDTFVKAHVILQGTTDRLALDEVLSDWISDQSRRHLAITGEYGQGKSTAMLEFCVRWAERYMATWDLNERVPLLIELRGQNPSESDPVAFLSAWAGRYGLQPKQVHNLIKAGEAVVIFEGFDELRNAGRAYDRHEHFNALWRLAYPGTKLVFTGRPNFFLDEKEKNRTLRADHLRGAAGNAFTQLWELDRLTETEVRKVVHGFGEALGESIMSAATGHPAFFDIISRPSMLPVVATIWEKIEDLQHQGHTVTSAVLLEHYLQAIYLRKEEEIEKDRRVHAAPEGANYLLLPREVREVFTLAIVWRMANADARNTISRSSFDGVVSQVFDGVFRIFQKAGVEPQITKRIRSFEERYRDETRNDRVERISNEVASAGIFVSDPAAGPSNLRLPHKQFYEYMIAKAAWITLAHDDTLTAKLIRSISQNRTPFENLLLEEQSLQFFSEIIGSDFSIFRRGSIRRAWLVWHLVLISAADRLSVLLLGVLRLYSGARTKNRFPYNEEMDRFDRVVAGRRDMRARILRTTTLVTFVYPIFFASWFFWRDTLPFGLDTFLPLPSRPVSRDVPELFLVLIFGVGLLLMILMTPLMVSQSFPRLAIFRRIVNARLKRILQPPNSELSFMAVNEECLLVLTKAPTSRIVNALGEQSSPGKPLDADREFRDSIAPHG